MLFFSPRYMCSLVGVLAPVFSKGIYIGTDGRVSLDEKGEDNNSNAWLDSRLRRVLMYARCDQHDQHVFWCRSHRLCSFHARESLDIGTQ